MASSSIRALSFHNQISISYHSQFSVFFLSLNIWRDFTRARNLPFGPKQLGLQFLCIRSRPSWATARSSLLFLALTVCYFLRTLKRCLLAQSPTVVWPTNHLSSRIIEFRDDFILFSLHKQPCLSRSLLKHSFTFVNADNWCGHGPKVDDHLLLDLPLVVVRCEQSKWFDFARQTRTSRQAAEQRTKAHRSADHDHRSDHLSACSPLFRSALFLFVGISFPCLRSFSLSLSLVPSQSDSLLPTFCHLHAGRQTSCCLISPWFRVSLDLFFFAFDNNNRCRVRSEFTIGRNHTFLIIWNRTAARSVNTLTRKLPSTFAGLPAPFPTPTRIWSKQQWHYLLTCEQTAWRTQSRAEARVVRHFCFCKRSPICLPLLCCTQRQPASTGNLFDLERVTLPFHFVLLLSSFRLALRSFVICRLRIRSQRSLSVWPCSQPATKNYEP